MSTAKAIEDYDAKRFGPLLGVSDEGSAAQIVADAAYASAKARAFGAAADAMCVGVMIDGERMTSAGEVPIGPDEYAQILPSATGRTFSTTNVGVRVNARLDQPLPEFRVADAAADPKKWLEGIFQRFKPFLDTPDGQPRPLTLRVLVKGSSELAALRALVSELESGRVSGRLGPPELHRLALLVAIDGRIGGAQLARIREAISAAAELKVPEVAVDGVPLDAARRRGMVQGLLNVLEPSAAAALLGEGASAGVRLTHRYDVDEESAARTVWTGLESARRNGLTAAKYGLVPLTFAQQEHVIELNQRWLQEWTPIPAFYVDTPLVTDRDVYQTDRCCEAAELWMSMAARHGAKVVLVDAPDRVTPRRLLKSDGGPSDTGVLTTEEIGSLTRHADSLGLRVLWSGGIAAKLAFDLARLQVGGIFTTSSASRRAAVHGPLVSDPQLDAAVEPTLTGVRRIHALIQAGFLSSALAGRDANAAAEIERGAGRLIETGPSGSATETALMELDELLIPGWKLHWR